MQDDGDFIAIVDLTNGVRNSAIYIVPTHIVNEHLRRNEELYVIHPGRRDKSSAQILRFFGDDKPSNTSFAYDRKFAEYRDGWDLLKSAPIVVATRGAVGRMAQQLIRSTTLTNDEIAARIRDALGSKTTPPCIARYRSQIRRSAHTEQTLRCTELLIRHPDSTA